MTLDHYELEPIERLVEAISDLEPIPYNVPVEPPLLFDAGNVAELAAATSDLELFVHALGTGHTHKFDPEMAAGRTYFVPLFKISMMLFCSELEPFGHHWPRPPTAEVNEWVSSWRSSHGVDENTDFALSELYRIMRPGPIVDGVRLVTWPIYTLTIRGSDLAHAEEVARACYARMRSGDRDAPLTKWLRSSKQPIPAPDASASRQTLTTKEVARMVGRSASTIRKWRMSGKGPPFHKMTASRAGGVYYLHDEVQAWLRDQRGQD